MRRRFSHLVTPSMRLPWFAPSSDADGRNLRLLVRRYAMSLSVAAISAKSLVVATLHCSGLPTRQVGAD